MENISFVGFNQDSECFMSGLDNGYRIFNTDPLEITAKEEGGGIKHVEMLYRCNYVGLVGGGKSPKYPTNKAIVWDDYQKKVVISLEFNTEVLSLRLRRDRIVVVLKNLIKVFTFNQSPHLLHVIETHSNPNGLCSLCSHSSNATLVYLSRERTGSVVLIDLAQTEKSGLTINAHDNAIQCLQLSNDGSKLATASTKGTLIRVFDTQNGIQLHELRRGANHANIFCINFNKQSSKLCVSSDHGTIHVFILDLPEKNSKSSLANATFLPKYFQSKWSSFKFDVNNHSKLICSFTQNEKQHSIIAIGMDGTYYKYALDNVTNMKSCQLEDCVKFLELVKKGT